MNIPIAPHPNGAGRPSLPSSTMSPAKIKPAGERTYDQYYCHTHKGGECRGPPFQCTYLRPSGKRCGFRFCPQAMKEIGVNVDMMLKVGLNDLSVEVNEHTPLATDYLFQCPRCQGICRCETCLEASANKGKAPAPKAGASQGKGWGSFMQESSSNQKKTAAKPKSSTSKKATAAPAKAPAAGPGKGKKKKDEPAAAKGKLAKETANDKDKTVLGQAPIKKAKAANGQPVKKFINPRPPIPPRPKLVEPPKLQTIDTKLPMPNIEARIYLYETLVRLTDVVKVPKTTLGSLDRFDAWTSRQCQQLLERLLAAAAGLSFIDRGQPGRKTGPAVRAYREFGSQPLRGEPWAAARDLIKEQLGHDVEDLPAVDRTAEEEREREEEDRLAAIAAAAEVPTLRVTRRMAAAERRLMARNESGSDTDRASGGRKTANSRSASSSTSRTASGSGARNGSRVVSRSRRRDLLGDSDDDDDDDDDDSSSDNGDSSDSAPRRPARGRKGKGRDGDSDDDMSDAGSGSSKQSAGSAYEGSDDEGRSNETPTVTAATSPPDSVNSGLKKNTEAPATVAEPIPAPHLEAKIAILCGLCDVVIQTPEAAKEIKTGIDGSVAAEKEHKGKMTQLEKEWAVQKEALNNEAPSMAAEIYAEWKQKKLDAERKHKWALIEENVRHALHLDTIKIRTGPIGRDMDGRVYWQLSEYIEKMPAQTGGRWAWCLLVEGPPFPRTDSPSSTGNGATNGAGDPTKKHDDGASSTSELSSLSAFSNHSSGLSSVPTDAGGPNGSRVQLLDNEADARKPFGGFDEHGRPRNNFEVAIPVRKKDGASSGASTSSTLSSLSTTSKNGETEKKDGAEVPSSNGVVQMFMGTNYPSEIKQLMKWLRYRCDIKHFQNLMLQVERPTPFTPAEVESQKAEFTKLRTETEELIRALNKVKEYYIWHLNELDSID